MTDFSRRHALIAAMAGAGGLALPLEALAAQSGSQSARGGLSARGASGQRSAKVAPGRFLNPVLSGDQPDPSILKDGDVYYKVSSSFLYYPGLVIWQSRDLVDWTPLGATLHKPVGSVFAPDLVKHGGRYFIYFPVYNPPAAGATPGPVLSILVIHADSISGPWSEPVDMKIYEGIDPGHVVGEDGKRYLYIDNGRIIPISDDGLARLGKAEKVYDGWPIPEEWVIEGFSLEGPKLIQKDGWFYMFSAQGGTAGPPTSHMVVVSRSRSVRGPWENSPHGALVHTASIDEPWWSRGHATPIQGPTGNWWLIYHGYENGYRTLGRQMLLEPFEWDDKGWPRAQGGDLSKPLPAPTRSSGKTHVLAVADDFSQDRFGTAIQTFRPKPDYLSRCKIGGGKMVVTAQGDGPKDSSPFLLNAGDQSYEFIIDAEVDGSCHAGILLFYDEQFFCGVGTDGRRIRSYKMGKEPYGLAPMASGTRVGLRAVNQQNIVTFYYRNPDKPWQKIVSLEVSGYNHNMADGFLSLRPAFYAARSGTATFRDLRYTALD